MGKILIVTPIFVLGLGLEQQFQAWGFPQVQLVSTCQQALKEALSLPPALVLLDTGLEQELDCLVLARQLQAATSPTAVIFMDQTASEAHLGRAGEWMPYPHAWLPKPCHPETLWRLVNSLLFPVGAARQQISVQ